MGGNIDVGGSNVMKRARGCQFCNSDGEMVINMALSGVETAVMFAINQIDMWKISGTKEGGLFTNSAYQEKI